MQKRLPWIKVPYYLNESFIWKGMTYESDSSITFLIIIIITGLA